MIPYTAPIVLGYAPIVTAVIVTVLVLLWSRRGGATMRDLERANRKAKKKT